MFSSGRLLNAGFLPVIEYFYTAQVKDMNTSSTLFADVKLSFGILYIIIYVIIETNSEAY